MLPGDCMVFPLSIHSVEWLFHTFSLFKLPVPPDHPLSQFIENIRAMKRQIQALTTLSTIYLESDP